MILNIYFTSCAKMFSTITKEQTEAIQRFNSLFTASRKNKKCLVLGSLLCLIFQMAKTEVAYRQSQRAGHTV